MTILGSDGALEEADSVTYCLSTCMGNRRLQLVFRTMLFSVAVNKYRAVSNRNMFISCDILASKRNMLLYAVTHLLLNYFCDRCFEV